MQLSDALVFVLRKKGRLLGRYLTETVYFEVKHDEAESTVVKQFSSLMICEIVRVFVCASLT